MRSSLVAARLQADFKISAEAARKRISRVKLPVDRFSVQLFPKGEGFLFHQDHHRTELFWTSLHSSLRDTNSVYGFAIDALLARGALVPEADFPVISGAPHAMKNQVSTAQVLESLTSVGILKRITSDQMGDCVAIDPNELGIPDVNYAWAQRRAESVLLDAIREWVRNLGIGSYNAVSIRGEKAKRIVGQFSWDLTAPSYLLPLKQANGRPGFVTADVFVGDNLDEFQIRYFLRKAVSAKASMRLQILPVLVAEGYTRTALQDGRSAGVMMATPTILFGDRVGAALGELFQTLRNAAAVAAVDPARFAMLIDDLSAIEGAAGNLRGILFELIAAHLARMDAVSVDVGVPARDPKTGKLAEIDVLKIQRMASCCCCIECKGKMPGGTVGVDEVDHWLTRIPTFRAHIVGQERFRETKISFELWTTGNFTLEALARLNEEKTKRTRYPIGWKDGHAVYEIAKKSKERAIRLALEKHFLKHPLSSL